MALALTSCTKSDDGPTPPQEKEFKEVGIPMEYYAPYDDEKTGGFYNFFTIQNDSDFPMYSGFLTRYCTGMTLFYLLPGEQATEAILMEYAPGLTMRDLRIDSLDKMQLIFFYFNAPAPGKFEPIEGAPAGWTRYLDIKTDTCAVYNFYLDLGPSDTPTPLDQSQWKYTHYNDHRIRWTYRVSNADHAEAVRQTLERWSDPEYKRPVI